DAGFTGDIGKAQAFEAAFDDEAVGDLDDLRPPRRSSGGFGSQGHVAAGHTTPAHSTRQLTSPLPRATLVSNHLVERTEHESSVRVLIAGGGLGGLTLAHGLLKAGLEPIVFERGPADVDLSTSYRIHIDANGSRALQACLPPAAWDLFENKSATPPRGIEFATERLQHLAFIPDSGAHPISRSGLRQLLLCGLDHVVQFEKRVVGYALSYDGTVVADLADGTTERGDVLVGADGSASAIRKQLLPHAQVVETGVAGIAGKLYLTDRMRERIGSRLLSQMTMVLPPRNTAMFMAPFL